MFQHPRCSNSHIPGDAPLQFDAQTPHAMNVVRESNGHGAPNWYLPPPDMAWIDVPAAELCAMIKDSAPCLAS